MDPITDSDTNANSSSLQNIGTGESTQFPSESTTQNWGNSDYVDSDQPIESQYDLMGKSDNKVEISGSNNSSKINHSQEDRRSSEFKFTGTSVNATCKNANCNNAVHSTFNSGGEVLKTFDYCQKCIVEYKKTMVKKQDSTRNSNSKKILEAPTDTKRRTENRYKSGNLEALKPRRVELSNSTTSLSETKPSLNFMFDSNTLNPPKCANRNCNNEPTTNSSYCIQCTKNRTVKKKKSGGVCNNYKCNNKTAGERRHCQECILRENRKAFTEHCSKCGKEFLKDSECPKCIKDEFLTKEKEAYFDKTMLEQKLMYQEELQQARLESVKYRTQAKERKAQTQMLAYTHESNNRHNLSMAALNAVNTLATTKSLGDFSPVQLGQMLAALEKCEFEEQFGKGSHKQARRLIRE